VGLPTRTSKKTFFCVSKTRFSKNIVRWAFFESARRAVLCVCYLENDVFLGTGIDQKISARHVFIGMHNCEPLPVVQHQTVFIFH
jgi:hypothetical protein